LDEAKATLPVNPDLPLTVMVLVVEAPALRVRLAGEAESMKPEPVGRGASVSIKFCPFGLPHPVTRS
jgi:hypothetical protein